MVSLLNLMLACSMVCIWVCICIFSLGSCYRMPSGTVAQDDVIKVQCTIPGVVAITFDDGPYFYTPEVLDVLKEKNVTSTFFVNGATWLALNETAQAFIRRATSERHTIGSHTWDHQHLTRLSPEEIRAEMTQLSEALIDLELLTYAPIFMRPPYGVYNDEAIDVIHNELNYTMVNWNIDTNDWQHPGDTEAGVQEYIDALKDTDPATTLGFIALHHDLQFGAAELASSSIDYARSLGYRFVSLEECLGLEKSV